VSEEHDDDLGFALPPPAAIGKTRMLAIGVLLATVVGGAFALAWFPRQRAHRALVDRTHAGDEHAKPRVQVVTPKATASDHALSLPATVDALEETIVTSRADGYVKRWLVDLGDKVTEGQLLCEIDTPELEQQLAAARAQLAQDEAQVAQAKANRELSKANLARYTDLGGKQLVSSADLDQRKAQAAVDEANVTAAEAAVAAQLATIRRLAQEASYAKVLAPFAGTVVARTVERGAYVTASGASALFRIAATDPVRVFVQVPQDLAPTVKLDSAAQVTVREYAGKVFAGRVTRTAGALDPASRTMTTEVRVPNSSGELMPGMYAQVALTLAGPHRVVELPATALYNDAKGVRVAVVDAGDVVRFVPVMIERDTGATIQIASGLDGTERVIKLANASLEDGAAVEVIP
jgi:RND family efflux transporter MFP subunit